jgi:hypothetical protein
VPTGRPGREPEALRRRGGQRCARGQAGQHGRTQLGRALGAAGHAVLDVPVDPFAQWHGEPSVPDGEHGGELTAAGAAGAAGKQYAEGCPELVAGPGN